jgi:hypothetical protein
MTENNQKDIKWIFTWGLLLLCCFLLATILFLINRNNQIGRYNFFRNESDFFVFDTKTGRTWQHFFFTEEKTAVFIDYGTPANPSCKIGRKTEFEKDYESLLKGLKE